MRYTLISAVLLSAFLLTFQGADAQSPVASSPVVYQTITVKSDPSFPVFKVMGTNLAKKTSRAAGTIDLQSTRTITDNGADFAAAFAGVATFDRDFTGPDPVSPNLFIEITSGPNIGINTEITSFTETTLTTMDDLSPFTSIGDSYIVREMLTIADVFGLSNAAGLHSGMGSAMIDKIWIPRGQFWDKVYYNPAPSSFPPATQGWKAIGHGDADVSNLPLYFSNGIIIERVMPPDLKFVVAGHVRVKPARVAIEFGFNAMDRLFPIGATLANSGLDALTRGTQTVADLVWMPKADSQGWNKYHYNLPTTFPTTTEGWKLVGGGDADQGSVPLTPGVIIERRTAGTNLLLTPDPAIYGGL